MQISIANLIKGIIFFFIGILGSYMFYPVIKTILDLIASNLSSNSTLVNAAVNIGTWLVILFVVIVIPLAVTLRPQTGGTTE